MDITKLAIPQLQQLREQMIEDAEALTSSFAQLRQIQGKYTSCSEVLNHLQGPKETSESESGAVGREVLVPLTNSLYVPARVASDRNVVVDVGTGYYVDRTAEDAQAYYKRKIEFLDKNTAKLQQTIGERRQQVNSVTDVLRARLEQAQMAQQGAAGQPASAGQ